MDEQKPTRLGLDMELLRKQVLQLEIAFDPLEDGMVWGLIDFLHDVLYALEKPDASVTLYAAPGKDCENA